MLFLVCCLLAGLKSASPARLDSSIAALNRGLRSRTNLVYANATGSGDIIAQLGPMAVPRLVWSGELWGELSVPRPLLVILPGPTDPGELASLFAQLPSGMQQSDFLIVGSDSAANWQRLLSALWQLGYPNVLIFNGTQHEPFQGHLYSRAGQLRRSSVGDYLWARSHWFDNLTGWQVRVAVYNNPPRTLVYPERQLYAGYSLLLLREFLAHRGAQFVPVLTPNHEVFSPSDCLRFLHENRSDICGDLLAFSSEVSFTASYKLLYGNVLVATSRPRSKNFYIAAPMQLKSWLLVVVYIAATWSFASLVSWLQQQRCPGGQLLLEIVASLLCSGFRLREIRGSQRAILYVSIFVVGFVSTNYYAAILATILSTGVYEPEIGSFEELIRLNISILIVDYDEWVLRSYGYPEMLWNITRVVPIDFMQAHRRILDPEYAYIGHSDRLALFQLQQRYMIKPRMRPLPIDLMYSLPGYPMRRQWLLQYKLSETLLNCFGSGLLQKLAEDTDRQTIRIGYLSQLSSTAYEPRALGLDFYSVPLKVLLSGQAIGFACLLGELLCGRVRARRAATIDGEAEERAADPAAQTSTA